MRRALLRITQAELAGRMQSHGWVQQTAGQVEAGRRRVVVDELPQLAVALDTSVPWLLGY